MAVATAAAVLWLSLPRMQASYRFLPVDRAIERYYQSRELPSARLLTLIGFAEQAIGYHDHYRYHDGLSLLHFLRGLDARTPALRRYDEYRAAEQAAIEAVRRAPAQPEAWLRIATVRAILQDEPTAILDAWRMSVFTGRIHSTLLTPRVGLALPYLPWLDPESQAMLRDQLLLAWRLKPRDLLVELKRRDPDLTHTRALIGSTEPATLAEMEVGIEKIR